MRKSCGGWCDNITWTTKYTYFRSLSDSDRQRIQKFIDDYSRFVILGLNRNISSYFCDELETCLALDYIAESPKALHRDDRTPIGQLWHDYKYENNRKVLSDIVDQMIRGLRRLPGLNAERELFLSFVPPKPNKRHDLPRELANKLTDRLTGDDSLKVSGTIIEPTLVIDKPEFKELTCEKKIETWQSIYDCRGVRLSNPVTNRSVIVIDDLYQSGTTLWSYARFLKSLGATAVYGLVCVKTLRDTDNR